MKKKLLVILFCLLSFTVYAKDIEGIYNIKFGDSIETVTEIFKSRGLEQERDFYILNSDIPDYGYISYSGKESNLTYGGLPVRRILCWFFKGEALQFYIHLEDEQISRQKLDVEAVLEKIITIYDLVPSEKKTRNPLYKSYSMQTYIDNIGNEFMYEKYSNSEIEIKKGISHYTFKLCDTKRYKDYINYIVNREPTPKPEPEFEI